MRYSDKQRITVTVSDATCQKVHLVARVVGCSTSRLASVALEAFCSDEEQILQWADATVRAELRQALEQLKGTTGKG